MTETNRYTVTDRAGPRVAGRRVHPGATIELTAAEAAYERRQGTIVPEGAKLSPAFSEDSPSLADLRGRAKGVEPVPAPAEPSPAPVPAPEPAEPAPRKPRAKVAGAVAEGA